MARLASVVALLLTALGPGAGSAASAQSLARLSVTSFDLAADTWTPKNDQPFHLIVTLRVRERVAQIENLNLPMLAQLDLLGDERETTSGPSGTTYREIVTVVAHAPGAVTVAPATLQAIDARDNKAKQWFTNSLTLHVTGDAAQGLRAIGGAIVNLALWLAFIAIVVAIVAAVVRRQKHRPPPVVLAPPQPIWTLPAVIERSNRAQVLDALAVLRAERTRASAVAVRTAIWRMVGASDGETLADVLRSSAGAESATRALLVALERSAFTYDADLAPAIEDACDALERYAESVA